MVVDEVLLKSVLFKTERSSSVTAQRGNRGRTRENKCTQEVAILKTKRKSLEFDSKIFQNFLES